MKNERGCELAPLDESNRLPISTGGRLFLPDFEGTKSTEKSEKSILRLIGTFLPFSPLVFFAQIRLPFLRKLFEQSRDIRKNQYLLTVSSGLAVTYRTYRTFLPHLPADFDYCGVNKFISCLLNIFTSNRTFHRTSIVNDALRCRTIVPDELLCMLKYCTILKLIELEKMIVHGAKTSRNEKVVGSIPTISS